MQTNISLLTKTTTTSTTKIISACWCSRFNNFRWNIRILQKPSTSGKTDKSCVEDWSDEEVFLSEIKWKWIATFPLDCEAINRVPSTEIPMIDSRSTRLHHHDDALNWLFRAFSLIVNNEWHQHGNHLNWVSSRCAMGQGGKSSSEKWEECTLYFWLLCRVSTKRFSVVVLLLLLKEDIDPRLRLTISARSGVLNRSADEDEFADGIECRFKELETMCDIPLVSIGDYREKEWTISWASIGKIDSNRSFVDKRIDLDKTTTSRFAKGSADTIDRSVHLFFKTCQHRTKIEESWRVVRRRKEKSIRKTNNEEERSTLSFSSNSFYS